MKFKGNGVIENPFLGFTCSFFMYDMDGQWLFSKRVIYNEQVADWIGSEENPAW